MNDWDEAPYRRNVLRPAQQTGELPDIFTRYGIEPDDADEAAIRTRVEMVAAFWAAERQRGAQNGELLAALLREDRVSRLTLLDPQARSAKAAEMRTARRHERDVQERDFAAEVATKARSRDGLTQLQRDSLAVLASLSYPMVEQSFVTATLDNYPVIAASTGVAPLTPLQRRTVSEALRNLALARGVAHIPSLYHAIGLSEATTDQSTINQKYDEERSAQRRMSHAAPEKAALDGVLSLVTMHLLKSDGLAYLATFQEEVQQSSGLRAASIRAVGDGRIGPIQSAALTSLALEAGLDDESARLVVMRLAAEMGAALESGAPTAYVRCGHCGRPHPSPDTPEHCTACSRPMFRSCPGCGRRCPASDDACAACGFDLSALVKAERLVAAARSALADRHPATALETVRAARLIDAATPGAEEVERMATEALDHALEQWRDIESALSDNRLYSARLSLVRLAEAAADVALGPKGTPPAARLAEVDARIATAERSLADAARSGGVDKEERLAHVLELAADCDDASRELARILPAPPRSVRVVSTSGHVRLQWDRSHSPGRLKYSVRRLYVAGATSRSEELLGTTSTPEFHDATAVAGAVAVYSVATMRAGVASTPTSASPTLVAREVDDLQRSARDGEVRLSWSSPPGGAVHVERMETDQPASRIMLKPDGDGIVDRSVENGRSYRYRVFVEYAALDGSRVSTPGEYVLAAPAARPEPVRDLAISRAGTRLRLRWTEPEHGTVEIRRCASQPVAFGTEIRNQDLANLGTLVAVGADGTWDATSGPSVVWFLPVIVSGDFGVAGRAVRHVDLPEVIDVKAFDLRTSICVIWQWPDTINEASVVWRLDGRVLDGQDDGVERLTITRARYMDAGGAAIPTPAHASLVGIAVYPVARVDGDVVVGSSAGPQSRAEVYRGSPIDVRYSLRRVGVMSRRMELVVSTGSFPSALPALVLIAKHGTLLPRSAGDGEQIVRIEPQRDLLGPYRVEVRPMPRPLTMRLFLEGAASASQYRVVDPNTSELVLS